MTYLREKVIANFRDRLAKKKNSENFKARPGMSPAHLVLIRNLPCCICGVSGSEAHHVKAGTGERGMGLRSTDRWAVPMCHEHHMEVERAGSKKENDWFAQRAVLPGLLAMDLWKGTGNLERMQRVLTGHLKGHKPPERRP